MADGLYGSDFYAWTREQSARLRSGDIGAADIPHIVEELESMGRSEKRALVSLTGVLLLHLLKWQSQPNHRGASWRLSIANARDDLADLLADNPSLRGSVSEVLVSAYRRARRTAAVETGLPEGSFPEASPFTFAQASDKDFWPD